jgi:hypothetical protein
LTLFKICVGGKDASVGKCAENSRGGKGKGAKGPKGPMERFIYEQKFEEEMAAVARTADAADLDCDKIDEKDKFYEKVCFSLLLSVSAELIRRI